MKKIISILLIIAMMATTMTVILAGTVTAVAAEGTVTVAEAAETDGKLTAERFLAGFLWFINEISKGIRNGGIFSALLDDVFDYVKENIIDIDSIYDYLENSGIVEWVAHLIFPR